MHIYVSFTRGLEKESTRLYSGREKGKLKTFDAFAIFKISESFALYLFHPPAPGICRLIGRANPAGVGF